MHRSRDFLSPGLCRVPTVSKTQQKGLGRARGVKVKFAQGLKGDETRIARDTSRKWNFGKVVFLLLGVESGVPASTCC